MSWPRSWRCTLDACYEGTDVTNDSPGHASGSLMLKGTGAAHNCIAHEAPEVRVHDQVEEAAAAERAAAA